MKFSLKYLTPLLALVLVFSMVDTAAAQATCNVSSAPQSRTTSSGRTEPTGGITFNCVMGPNDAVVGTLTVDYPGVVITSDEAIPAGNPIQITNVGGDLFASASGDPTISVVSNATGQVIVSLPSVTGHTAGDAGTFTLQGVLVSLAGTGLTSLNATVSVDSIGSWFLTAGQTNPVVINQVLAGLASFELDEGPAVILTNGFVPTGTETFSVEITENYLDMFRSAAQFNQGGASNSTRILLTAAGIPAGVTLGSCTIDSTGAATAAFVSGDSFTQSPGNTLTIDITDGDLTAVNTLTVTCEATTGSALSLTPGAITLTATLTPNTPNTNAVNAAIPRYVVQNLGPITVANIVPASTTMLISYATSGGGFDTGIAIANTTADPFTTGGALPGSGPIQFHFFPADGSATFSHTSAAVDAGESFIQLLSALVNAASGSSNFTGYIFIEAEFMNAHGAAFISDFSGFTSFTPILVLPPPLITDRFSSDSVESLGF